MAYCSQCGKELFEGVKFCSECGNKVEQDVDVNKHRKIVYEGEVHKCPNCGEVLAAFVLNCPSCDYELRETKVSGSIKDFAMNLTEARSIEQKVDLIKNFPIPNTREDIFEFMILASSNYDATVVNKENTKKDISDAWLTKIEQCYQKAKLIFNDDGEIGKIKEMYTQTYSKICEAVKRGKRKFFIESMLRTIGLWGGMLIFIVAFFIDIGRTKILFSDMDYDNLLKYLLVSNTSVYHLAGGIVMIAGALMIGRKSKELLDVGIGTACGLGAILLGTILEMFSGNGSMMELAGGATLIISIVRMVKSFGRKDY